MQLRQRIVSGLFSFAACAALGGVLWVMNARQHGAKEVSKSLDAEVAVKPKAPPPKKKNRPKPKPKRRPRRKAAAPRPSLSSNMSGLAAGLPVFDSGDLSGMANGLLGSDKMAKDMVMTEGSVDNPPRPSPGNRPPVPPARAASKGISGHVKLRLLINSSGQVTRVKVVESVPQGFFDESATEAAQNWTFEPATYQGQPVKTWSTMKLRFKLG